MDTYGGHSSENLAKLERFSEDLDKAELVPQMEMRRRGATEVGSSSSRFRGKFLTSQYYEPYKDLPLSSMTPETVPKVKIMKTATADKPAEEDAIAVHRH
ncbi:unnamed protein product [Nezara viridula]|uniref:Uncharacterized protein n=1 Tax=Nezara viridula TaxID=85310 RepID=A0A9P0E5U0_NEZVI|nr:unnamed protein product [Nezara viridula]